MSEENDFLSFSQELEKQQAQVNIWQNNGGSSISYPFRMLCRLETQKFVIFRLSGDHFDYNFNPQTSLNLTFGETSQTIAPDSFIFDGRCIIVKYTSNASKVTAQDTKVDDVEARRNTRFNIKKEYKAKIEVGSLRLSEKIVAILIDLSQSGIAFRVPQKHGEPLQIGDQITINKIAREKIDMLEGTVVHKKIVDHEKQHYKIALEFNTPLKMTKVLALVKLCKAND